MSGPFVPRVGGILSADIAVPAESLRRVREGGGQIIKATLRTDGEYAYAVVQDPVGACLALGPG